VGGIRENIKLRRDLLERFCHGRRIHDLDSDEKHVRSGNVKLELATAVIAS